MRTRLYSILVLCLTVSGCFGSKKNNDSNLFPTTSTQTANTPQALLGTWQSWQPGADGKNIRMRFKQASDGRYLVHVGSMDADDTYEDLASGTYNFDGSTLTLNIGNSSTTDTITGLSGDTLNLGSLRFDRLTTFGSEPGALIVGQVQITSDENRVGLTSNSRAAARPPQFRVVYQNAQSPVLASAGNLRSLQLPSALENVAGVRAQEKFESPRRSVVTLTPEAVPGTTKAFSLNAPAERGVAGVVSRALATRKRVDEIQKDFCAEKLKDPQVKDCYRLHFFELQGWAAGGGIPSDSLYAQQWNLKLLGMNQAWGRLDPAQYQSSVVVAVVDGGVRPGHPDLAGSLLKDSLGNVIGYDFTSEGDTDPTDTGDGGGGFSSWGLSGNYHGTHVSGIIAGGFDNAKGVSGMSGPQTNVKIMPIRVVSKEDLDVTQDDLAQAIYFAIGDPNEGDCADADACTSVELGKIQSRPPAKVINMSLGGFADAAGARDMTVLHAAIQRARAKGVLVVVASGNLQPASRGDCRNLESRAAPGENCDFYPAAWPEVLSVGGVNFSGKVAGFSNYTRNPNHVLAPSGGDSGSGVLSAVNESWSVGFSKGYGELEGTSQAAPHVSALAALLWSQNLNFTVDQIQDFILNNSIVLPASAGSAAEQGKGLIQPARAICAARGLTSCGSGGVSVSHDSIAFGYTSQRVLVTVWGATASPQVSSSTDWLGVQVVDYSQSLGLAQVEVVPDRSKMQGDELSATVTITSNNQTVTIPVTATGGEPAPLNDDDGEFDQLLDDFIRGLDDVPEQENEFDVGSITVVLYDSQQRPVAGKHYTTRFNQDYYFAVSGLPAGAYYLRACTNVSENPTVACPSSSQLGVDYFDSFWPSRHAPGLLELSPDEEKTDVVVVFDHIY